MLFLQSILLNWLLEQSLVIHNRCTGDVISHPIHQSPDSIKLNLGWAPSCVIDRHIALTSHPFAVVQTWGGDLGGGWGGGTITEVGKRWVPNDLTMRLFRILLSVMYFDPYLGILCPLCALQVEECYCWYSECVPDGLASIGGLFLGHIHSHVFPSTCRKS